MDSRDRLVFALDVPDGHAALRLVRLLAGEVGTFKVGLELFCAEGPALVREVSERGGAVFLDLKLHDIPATVGRAVARALAGGGVRWLTVHTGGGREMLSAAVRAAGAGGGAVGGGGILGVTVLTSLNEAGAVEAGLSPPLGNLVVRRAALAADCGCVGVVASPQEAGAIRRVVGPGPLIVTPGIRPPGAEAGDQQRTAPPGEAIAAGADVVVVGRPIRDAVDPVAAARAIRSAIDEALGGAG
ncbi:MAG: orotidine-5'-phosphate decarboxylase [Deltaproteobacteria bacterium]|nr:orotidine-5'-phosphate decarboxylase [Deltaproteobacteria bacterium]